jgi:GT2 family glycosyltransferase
MESPLFISLIVCTYRRPSQVRSLLQSIVEQTRQPDEILIVDASTDDETEAIVNSFRDDGRFQDLRYYRVTAEDRGLTRQRNYGIARARGDTIAFLDDDTILEPTYFEEIIACFNRHPDAVGVGGYIANEVKWSPANGRTAGLSVFRWGEWERREDFRWRLRKLFKLVSPLPPGWMPASGHGRPIGFLPADGNDYRVEFFMGGAAVWTCKIFARHHFSVEFDGYGLYEDMDFCLRAAKDDQLYLCTRARLSHHHAPSGRPRRFRYGTMVVRNGWSVWKERWPNPSLADRFRWWCVTLLLASCRMADFRDPRFQGVEEALGRFYGAMQVLCKR